MGQPIVYCGDCGTSLRGRDFERGRAHEVDRTPYCSGCRPPSRSAVPTASTRASTGSLPRIGTTRRRAARRTSGPAWVLAGAALVAVAVLIAVLSAPAPRPPEAAALPAAAPAVDPSESVDHRLDEVRKIRARDPGFRRASEVRALLRRTAAAAGPRRQEVEAILAEYEKDAAGAPAGVAPVSFPPATK